MKFDNLTDKSKLSDICVNIGPIKCIYDCGSFDGLDGLHLCNLLNPLELHIFQCNPPSYELILKNVELFGNKKIKIVPNKIGLSNMTGEEIFFPIDIKKTITPHKNGNPGASSFYKADASYRAEKYVQDQLLVKTIRLDDYVKNNNPPDLLWMDLQGFELNVLEGLGNHIENVKLIHVEVGFRSMYKGGALFGQIDDYLKEAGFELLELDCGKWPKLPKFYKLIKFGPWIANAIYCNSRFL